MRSRFTSRATWNATCGWGFDGKKFSRAEPIHLRLGERVRFTLINDTMMEHPIHLDI